MYSTRHLLCFLVIIGWTICLSCDRRSSVRPPDPPCEPLGAKGCLDAYIVHNHNDCVPCKPAAPPSSPYGVGWVVRNRSQRNISFTYTTEIVGAAGNTQELGPTPGYVTKGQIKQIPESQGGCQYFSYQCPVGPGVERKLVIHSACFEGYPCPPSPSLGYCHLEGSDLPFVTQLPTAWVIFGKRTRVFPQALKRAGPDRGAAFLVAETGRAVMNVWRLSCQRALTPAA
jgi:hypothetical protein